MNQDPGRQIKPSPAKVSPDRKPHTSTLNSPIFYRATVLLFATPPTKQEHYRRMRVVCLAPSLQPAEVTQLSRFVLKSPYLLHYGQHFRGKASAHGVTPAIDIASNDYIARHGAASP